MHLKLVFISFKCKKIIFPSPKLIQLHCRYCPGSFGLGHIYLYHTIVVVPVQSCLGQLGMCVSLPGPPVGGPFQLVLPLTHESPPALHHHPPPAELPQLLVAAAPVRTAEPAPAPSVPPPPRLPAAARAVERRSSAPPRSARRPPLRPPVLHCPGRVSDPGRPTPGALSFPAWDARRWHSATVDGHGPQRHRSHPHSVGSDWCVLSTQSPSRFSPSS